MFGSYLKGVDNSKSFFPSIDFDQMNSKLLSPRSNVPERLIMDANRRQMVKSRIESDTSHLGGLLSNKTMDKEKFNEMYQRFENFEKSKNEKITKEKEIRRKEKLNEKARQKKSIHYDYCKNQKMLIFEI